MHRPDFIRTGVLALCCPGAALAAATEVPDGFPARLDCAVNATGACNAYGECVSAAHRDAQWTGTLDLAQRSFTIRYHGAATQLTIEQVAAAPAAYGLQARLMLRGDDGGWGTAILKTSKSLAPAALRLEVYDAFHDPEHSGSTAYTCN